MDTDLKSKGNMVYISRDKACVSNCDSPQLFCFSITGYVEKAWTILQEKLEISFASTSLYLYSPTRYFGSKTNDKE